MMRITGAVLEDDGVAGVPESIHRLNIVELELAEPGNEEILVRIEAAGLCHSDLSVLNGSRERPRPMLLGHEAAGRIEAVGPGVHELRAGQRVVMTFLPRCEACAACLTGGKLPCTPGSAANTAGELLGGGRRLSRDQAPVHHHLGVSAFANYAVVSQHSVVPVEDDVPAEVAAVLGCAVLTGGGALLNAAKPEPGASIAVVGLGGVGMAALLVALSGESGTVIGIDALPVKLEEARRLGADAAYTPDEAQGLGIRADVVIEAAGHPRAFETAVAMTAPGGITVTVGLPSPESRSSISPLTITAEARTIIGSYLGSAVPAVDIPKYVELWRQGRLPVEKLISSRIKLAQINEGFASLSRGETLRQVITFDE